MAAPNPAGESRLLAEALGYPEPFPPSALLADAGRATTAAALESGLSRWIDEALTAEEWPVIVSAWALAREGKARELAALDLQWGLRRGSDPLAEASWRAGRRQLNRLRPLRSERVVQRYGAAVDAGGARGWHPIVFGLVTAVFHLPLRPALLSYGAHSIDGFLQAAARSLSLPASETTAMSLNLKARLPGSLPELAGSAFAASA